MKYTANVISIIRMLMSALLIFSTDNKVIFFIIYILCGFSDFIDGYIARKTGSQSNLGARLDSFADLLFFGAVTAVLVIWAGSQLKNFLIIIALIILIRLINLFISLIKYHSPVFLHTWANKATGFLIFFTPLVFLVTSRSLYFYIVCVAAVLSAIEDGIIHFVSAKPDLNRKGLFFK
ncbi:MAG: CDP-alcohol phosphatidyltransferase family protein [Bacillota bacterium]|nr:CDP-alcohol phosphatidyltransferase family protein [Bacillota bacterium]